MELAGILLGAILVGSFMAVATGVIVVVGLLEVLRGTGVQAQPPISRASIRARQRRVDARLRARYLSRARATIDELQAVEPVPAEDHGRTDDPAAAWSQPAVFVADSAT
jgi:hypothetical protein